MAFRRRKKRIMKEGEYYLMVKNDDEYTGVYFVKIAPDPFPSEEEALEAFKIYESAYRKSGIYLFKIIKKTNEKENV